MQVLFVFLDSDRRNLYQLRQWIQPLQRLSKTHDVSVLYANEIASSDLAKSGLESHRVDLDRGLIDFLNAHQPKLLLYPNQNTLNFFASRYSQGIHAWVSHGESDKAYMSQNTLKRYDLYFAAGQVAKERVLRNVAAFSPERIKLIGRPQLADVHEVPQDFATQEAQGLKVLYAPTWEGATSATQYGSIATHGEAIVRQLIQLGHRVVYRPHPLSGTRDAAVAAADASIRTVIDLANSQNPQRHYVDSSEFGWQLRELDFLITDVSAVAYDWLGTGKPLLITNPEHPDAILPDAPLFSALELLRSDGLNDLQSAMDAARASGNAEDAHLAELRAKYFGTSDPDQQFKAAVDEALDLQGQLGFDRGAAANALPRFARRAPWLRSLLRYPSFALRIMLKWLGLWATVREKPPISLTKPLRNLYVHFSDAFDVRSLVGVARELFEIAKVDGEVHVATNQATTFAALKAHFWWHGRAAGAAKPRLHLYASTTSADGEVLLQGLKPERVLYLKDHPNNLMLLRLNGTKHFLYRPESDPGFEPTHSLTMYDAVVTNSAAAQEAVQSILAISRPALQKFGSSGA
jgi:hypothetical protein